METLRLGTLFWLQMSVQFVLVYVFFTAFMAGNIRDGTRRYWFDMFGGEKNEDGTGRDGKITKIIVAVDGTGRDDGWV